MPAGSVSAEWFVERLWHYLWKRQLLEGITSLDVDAPTYADIHAANAWSSSLGTAVRRHPGAGALISGVRAEGLALGIRRPGPLRLTSRRGRAAACGRAGEAGDVLFRAPGAGGEAGQDLLGSSTTLSQELTRLIDQSREDLKPALAHLENVVAVLNKNEDNLDSSLRLMAPFYRVFANTLGTGPWFDTWISNFPPVPQVG